MVGLAALPELRGVLRRSLQDAPVLPVAARGAGLVLAPTVAAYTAALLSDTATPSWHAALRDLPFVFVGSAAAAASGAAMLAAPLDEASPARQLAVTGAVVDLAVSHRMEGSWASPPNR